MIIQIPGIVPYKGSISSASNTKFLNTALGQPKHLHFTSRTSIAHPRYERNSIAEFNANAARDAAVSKLCLSAHDAFAFHVPFSISPEIMWYSIIHDVGILVKSDVSKYGHLFSNKPEEKMLIEVRDDSLAYLGENDWNRVIHLFLDPMRQNMPGEMLDVFLPKFSTATPESDAAILVAFMDTVSEYCEFRLLTLCGVPRVRIEGLVEDWKLLYDHADQLMRTFPALKAYFADLLPVIKKIALTVDGESPDMEFWASLYKIKDGSGGPHVSGWLTAFSAYLALEGGGFKMKKSFDWHGLHQTKNSGYTTDQFPSHVSKVNFTWQYFQNQIPMGFASGVTGVDNDLGFLTPRLGFVVYERTS